ncbi:MAG: ABC transporter permease [Bdellovibrionota bacterium]
MDLQTQESLSVKMAGNQGSLTDAQKKDLETALPLWKIVMRQFLEHKMAVVSLGVILFFVLVAFSADLIAKGLGLDSNRQNVSARYLLPFSRTEIPNDAKESSIETWISENPEKSQALSKALIDKQILMSQRPADEILFELGTKPQTEALQLFEKISQPEFVSFKKMLENFGSFHLFGTDEVGRDVFIRLIYGTRVSMGVGVMVAVASALVGLFIGSLAGFYGGIIDTLLMRVTDSLLSLPLVPVLIVVAAIDLQKLPALKSLMNPENESIVKMFLILCLFSWMTVARLVRGSILSLREREFVLAARTLGARDRTIIFSHMFPNVIAPMLVAITLGVGQSILFEAALSFLGLGIMPPTPSWGNMLNNAQEVIYKNVWLTILPGIMIWLTTISFNFVGDGLQDAVDPKSIRR